MKLKTKTTNWLFLLCIACFFIFLGYGQILFMHPQSVHFQRQTDSLSFILHYLKYGMHFLEPGTLNLESTDGKAASEFPVIYYGIAWLYKLFGEHEYFLRLFHVLIVFTGFYCVYKMLTRLFQDSIYSLVLTFIILGSPVILYYTNNFLPDAGALGFILVGLFLFYNYAEDSDKWQQGISAVGLLTLASLIKASFFIYLLAFFGTLFLNGLFFDKTGILSLLNKHKWIIAAFLIGLLSIISWNVYVLKYNEQNHADYFLTRPVPYWGMDFERRAKVWEHIFTYWYNSYFPVNTHILLYALSLIGILFGYKANQYWYILTLVSGIGALCYFLLFFAQFQYHDYYFFALVPFIIIGAANGLITIQRFTQKGIFTFFLKATFLVFCFYGITEAKDRLWYRYHNHPDDQNDIIATQIEKISPLYTAAGVQPDARFIIVCDATKNGGLYFANRMGWPVSYANETVRFIHMMLEQQVEYVFFTDTSYVELSGITDKLDKKIVQTDNLVLYSLCKD